MKIMSNIGVAIVAVGLVSCGGGGNNPTSPSPIVTPTPSPNPNPSVTYISSNPPCGSTVSREKDIEVVVHVVIPAEEKGVDLYVRLVKNGLSVSGGGLAFPRRINGTGMYKFVLRPDFNFTGETDEMQIILFKGSFPNPEVIARQIVDCKYTVY